MEAVALDDFVKEQGLEKVDVIKLDVEGAERAVLKGAKKTIKKFKPILLISVYHQEQDLFETMRLVDEIRDDYRWVFRWMVGGMVRGVPPVNTAETMLIGF